MDVAIVIALRLALAVLLAAAALHKLRDVARFRLTLQSYDVLPAPFLNVAAWLLLAAEAAAAAWLMSGLAAGAAGAAVAALMLTYAVAIAINLRRGRTDIDCGCAGPAARIPLSAALVVRNILVAAGALLLALPVAARPLHWIDALTVSGALAALCACWLASERMLALAPALSRLRHA
ncbi:MAG TPA: MauE/DoxX family redox-associated membrane protein [Candidatus Limnocylindrales bacterium]|nr:MauE/DoxX family redox-associated membrane protein [Candidatus Limnocylindrales bacterium]